MNLLIIGPPASGKGTQADKLIKKFGLAYINMGGIIRSIKDQDTPLSNKVMEYVNKGIWVPDDIIIELINSYLKGIDRIDGLLFDGFPRVLAQAEYFDKYLEEKGKKIDIAIYITLPEEVSVDRLGSRRTCSKCGQVYNLITNPPKKEGICDACNGELVVRSDETPEAIASRLNEFTTKTIPMINFYRGKGILEEIDGNHPIETIFEDIQARLIKRGLVSSE